MKYYIIILVFIFLLWYFYKSLRLQIFRENLTIGNKVSYYSKNKKVKGEIKSIKRNVLGKITFVYVNDIILHVENIYK